MNCMWKFIFIQMQLVFLYDFQHPFAADYRECSGDILSFNKYSLLKFKVTVWNKLSQNWLVSDLYKK